MYGGAELGGSGAQGGAKTMYNTTIIIIQYNYAIIYYDGAHQLYNTILTILFSIYTFTMYLIM